MSQEDKDLDDAMNELDGIEIGGGSEGEDEDEENDVDEIDLR